jgi:hypothetical protein
MGSCGIAQDLAVRVVFARDMIARDRFVRRLIARNPRPRDWVANGVLVRGALLPPMIADDFPDPWGFSDCEDGLT